MHDWYWKLNFDTPSYTDFDSTVQVLNEIKGSIFQRTFECFIICLWREEIMMAVVK